MSITWIDFNDIFTWRLSHFTGIQRVVVKVSEQLIQDERFKLFIFYESSQTFYEVDKNSFPEALASNCSALRTVGSAIEFQSNDNLLFLGGSWVKPTLLKTLTKVKEKLNIKVTHFIHDVSPITVPHVHKKDSKDIILPWLKEVSDITDQYITNSEFSKSELIKVLNQNDLNLKDVKVIRLADEIMTKKASEPKAKISKPFLLFVSSFEPRKNHYLIYQAIKILKQKYPDEQLPQVLFVGSKGWNSDHLRHFLLNDPELKNNLRWLTNISDNELTWLYQNCLFTLYPSLYEGWGMPVAESLAHGKVCIASDAASIPEIGKDITIYHNPYDADDLSFKIHNFIENPVNLNQRELAIKNQYKITSWKETATEIFVALDG